MEHAEDTTLHGCAVDLTKKAYDISEKIKNQSMILESIHVQIENNDQVFKKNQGIFADALERLDRDKRNILIVFLVFVIILLVYALKN